MPLDLRACRTLSPRTFKDFFNYSHNPENADSSSTDYSHHFDLAGLHLNRECHRMDNPINDSIVCHSCGNSLEYRLKDKETMAQCPFCGIKLTLNANLSNAGVQPADFRSSAILPIRLPAVEKSKVAVAIFVLAILDLVGSVVGGVAIGGLEEQAELGWLVFFSGIFSGIVLLGLAQIVQCNFESVQRLLRIELLLVENNCWISRKL
jgi:uncharacterized paraquat-inducible protein A